MRYEELNGPLKGWTYDENGTIYTASGYRTSARQIEFCMWMYECMRKEVRHWLIHSDEAAGALRPVYELSDLTTSQQPTRLCMKAKNGLAGGWMGEGTNLANPGRSSAA